MRHGEANAIERSFPKGGGMPRHPRPHGEVPGLVRRHREQSREQDPSPLWWFCGKEWVGLREFRDGQFE